MKKNTFLASRRVLRARRTFAEAVAGGATGLAIGVSLLAANLATSTARLVSISQCHDCAAASYIYG